MKKEKALLHLLLVQGRQIAGLDLKGEEARAAAALREMIDSLEVSPDPGQAYRVTTRSAGKVQTLLANEADFSFYARADGTAAPAPEKAASGAQDPVAESNAAHARALWGVLLRLAEAPLAQERLAQPPAAAPGIRSTYSGLEIAIITYAAGLVTLHAFIPLSQQSQASILALASLAALLAADLWRSPWALALAGAALAVPLAFDRTLGLCNWVMGLMMYDLSSVLAPWRTSKSKLAALHGTALLALVLVFYSSHPSGIADGPQGGPFLAATGALLAVLSLTFWFAGTHLNPLRIFIPPYLFVLCQISRSPIIEAPVAVLLLALWLVRFPFFRKIGPRSAIHAG